MYRALQDFIDGGVRCRLTADGEPVSYAGTLALLQEEASFRQFFITLLAASPFNAYRWETPSVSLVTASREFEFVLLDTPALAVAADPRPFEAYFCAAPGTGIVDFDNLGGDARLVVPSPRASHAVYPHLGAFIRGAPPGQIHAFWGHVAHCVQHRLSDSPLWLSTAGTGVAWLHVRLDRQPKYYGYPPYRAASEAGAVAG